MGEVTIQIRAADMNPADLKHIPRGSDRSFLPIAVGYEVSGVNSAIGANTAIASGGGAIGDDVIAFRVNRGYAAALTVDAKQVFPRPASQGFSETAKLLGAIVFGTTSQGSVPPVERFGAQPVAERSGIVRLAAMQRTDSVHTQMIRRALPANT